MNPFLQFDGVEFRDGHGVSRFASRRARRAFMRQQRAMAFASTPSATMLNIGSIAPVATGSEIEAQGTRLGSMRATFLEQPGFEAGRVARSFVGGCGIIANAVVPVTAIPTTTAAWGLFNTNLAGSGKLCHIKQVALWYASGTAGADGAALFGAVTSTVLATPLTANGTGYTIQASRGYGTPNYFMSTAQTFPSGSTWGCLSPSTYVGAATVTGLAIIADVRHLGYIVPPLYAFGLSAVGDTGTTAKYGVTVWWDEIDGDLP